MVIHEERSNELFLSLSFSFLAPPLHYVPPPFPVFARTRAKERKEILFTLTRPSFFHLHIPDCTRSRIHSKRIHERQPRNDRAEKISAVPVQRLRRQVCVCVYIIYIYSSFKLLLPPRCARQRVNTNVATGNGQGDGKRERDKSRSFSSRNHKTSRSIPRSE